MGLRVKLSLAPTGKTDDSRGFGNLGPPLRAGTSRSLAVGDPAIIGWYQPVPVDFPSSGTKAGGDRSAKQRILEGAARETDGIDAGTGAEDVGEPDGCHGKRIVKTGCDLRRGSPACCFTCNTQEQGFRSQQRGGDREVKQFVGVPIAILQRVGKGLECDRCLPIESRDPAGAGYRRHGVEQTPDR